MPSRRARLLGVLSGAAACATISAAHAQEPPATAPGASAGAARGAVDPRIDAELDQTRRRLDQLDAKLAAVVAQGEALRAQATKLEAAKREVEALRADFQLQSVLGKGTAADEKVRLYGFMDMGFQYMSFGQSPLASGAIQSQSPTFAMGNINLYVDVQPFEHWRGLFEVRFTNYPDGSSRLPALGQPFNRTSTQVYDVTSPSGGWSQIEYGSIVLERAFIQWSPVGWFNARIGYWPTPYGIWNVDHGTPTRISLNEPQFVVTDAFPSKQTGLDLTGTVVLSPWELEYHAYVSNGRTPGQLSLTNGKAVGGRLALKRSLPFPVVIGASAFYGRYSDVQAKLAPGSLVVDQTQVVAYDEEGFAADLSIDLKPVRIRSEFVLDNRVYDDGARDPSPLGVGALPSQTFWGTYLLAAYRLPWAGLEPYAFTELDRNLVPSAQGAASLSGGLNVYVTPGVQIKLQYTHLKLFDFDSIPRPPGQTAINFVASRIVLAF